MYGKSYEQKYRGSMIGAGFHVFAVWDYVITNTHRGMVELNPKLLAFTLAGTRPGAEDDVREAIEYLCSPDPKSNSKAEGGRRMVQEGEYQYRVVNWDDYQRIRNAKDLKEYNRVKQSEYRARKKKPAKNIPSARERKFEEAVQNGDRAEADRLTDGARAESSESFASGENT